MFLSKKPEHSACGVGFVASRTNAPSHALLKQALEALRCVEHRGACAADNVSADGVGIMTDIPFELLGYERGSIAVATLFLPTVQNRLRLALKIFEETFAFMGMEVLEYRDVKFDPRVEKIDIVPRPGEPSSLDRKHIFRYTEEDLERLLIPMILTGKEPIGSMGDRDCSR